MSGGVYEYTAAYVDNGNTNLGTFGSSLVSADVKYKDVYTSNGDTYTGNYGAASSKKGEAVYETSENVLGAYSWYADDAYMPYSASPFFLRGGPYHYSTVAGAFSFNSSVGYASVYIGFRPVLALAGSL